jgi:energy-coupling factor transport system ATP-binding protein
MDISLKHVDYRYQVNTPFERLAIEDVSIDIPSGVYMAIIGHTGSGKSTVLQHLNALLQPTKGTVEIGEHEIKASQKNKNLKKVRQKVGIVFQFPEHQLFEETVEKDIIFGPMNFGVSETEAKERARVALKQVGLEEDILNKSPFDLSGGQMRRVAIAGVLAMEPDVIVLDEPTAGLDPTQIVPLEGPFNCQSN